MHYLRWSWALMKNWMHRLPSRDTWWMAGSSSKESEAKAGATLAAFLIFFSFICMHVWERQPAGSQTHTGAFSDSLTKDMPARMWGLQSMERDPSCRGWWKSCRGWHLISQRGSAHLWYMTIYFYPLALAKVNCRESKKERILKCITWHIYLEHLKRS